MSSIAGTAHSPALRNESLRGDHYSFVDLGEESAYRIERDFLNQIIERLSLTKTASFFHSISDVLTV
jgi:hypothetical protein